MLFKDYFDLIKKYYKKKPSDPDLCRDLFNSVLENIDDDAFYDYEKSAVSRILKGERKIPSIIRDHIYDESVEEGIADYFSNFIIPQLIPNHSNLIHELITLLEKYPNISKPHFSTLKSIAKENSLGAFLSEVYRYAVIEGTSNSNDVPSLNENVKTTISTDKEPVLSLCGITLNNSLADSFTIEVLSNKTKVSREFFREKLRNQYNEVSNLHLSTEYKPLIFNGTNLGFNKKTEIDESTIIMLTKVAKTLGFIMSADFFELGGLTTNILSSAALLGGGVELNGTVEEKHKYDLIYKIEDTINEFAKALPFIDAFKNIMFIRLAVKNSGTMHDENINLSLSFDKGTILTIEEIANMGKDVYDYIMYECNQQQFFGIDRGLDYLDYNSSVKAFKPNSVKMPNINNPFGYISATSNDVDKTEELTDYFDYYISNQDNHDVVKVTIEEVIHNDAVALPSIIMLKKKIESIEYTIHSKYMPEKIVGKIVAISKE